IKQKDFYRFYAFFNTVPERGLDGYEGNADPVLPLPTPEQKRQMDDLNRQIASVLTAMPEKEVLALRNEWQKTRIKTLPTPPSDGPAISAVLATPPTRAGTNGIFASSYSSQRAGLIALLKCEPRIVCPWMARTTCLLTMTGRARLPA